VPALIEHLGGEPRLAWQCARALAHIDTPQARQALQAAARGDSAAATEVRKGWAWALKERSEE